MEFESDIDNKPSFKNALKNFEVQSQSSNNIAKNSSLSGLKVIKKAELRQPAARIVWQKERENVNISVRNSKVSMMPSILGGHSILTNSNNNSSVRLDNNYNN